MHFCPFSLEFHLTGESNPIKCVSKQCHMFGNRMTWLRVTFECPEVHLPAEREQASSHLENIVMYNFVGALDKKGSWDLGCARNRG